jgi:hypothetical protein
VIISSLAVFGALDPVSVCESVERHCQVNSRSRRVGPSQFRVPRPIRKVKLCNDGHSRVKSRMMARSCERSGTRSKHWRSSEAVSEPSVTASDWWMITSIVKVGNTRFRTANWVAANKDICFERREQDKADQRASASYRMGDTHPERGVLFQDPRQSENDPE